MRHHCFTNSRGVAHVTGDPISGGVYKSLLEKHGLIRWLMNPDVEHARLQQPRIRYRDGLSKPHRYTGDLLVEKFPQVGRRPLVIEFKYKKKLADEPELKTKHEAVGRAFDRYGHDFEVQTEDDVYAPGFEMMKFVYGYRNNQAHPASGEITASVVRNPGISLSELVKTLRCERLAQLELVAEVWRLVAVRELATDFLKVFDDSTKLYPGVALPH
jgi:hypothetical protein